MKKTVLLLTWLLCTLPLFAQEEVLKKPEYVIIADNEIITREQLDEYGEQGYVKSMSKGVSEELRNELAEKFGDKIGDRAFIILIGLRTEEERTKVQEKADSGTAHKNKPADDGLKLHINDEAKDFTVRMLEGNNITLSDLKGKVVLLNFWATWCGPCLMEFYEIPGKILEPYKNSDFVFIPVSRGESEEKVREMMLKLKNNGIDFKAGIDPKEEIWDQYATKGIPKNFLIDQNGVIQFISTGYSEESVDEIAAEINKLLAE